MQHTSNYNLPQWEASDPIKRADFNGAMSAIDTAVKAASDAAGAGAKIAYGTYTGTGTYGSANPKTLTFSFQPKLVIVEPDTGDIAAYPCQFGFFFRGQNYAQTKPNAAGGGNDANVAKLTWSGNSVSWYGQNVASQLNANNFTYFYLAIG